MNQVHPFSGVPIIDFHTHAFPDKIAQRAVDQLASHYKIRVSGNGTFQDLSASAAKAGIEKLCLHSAATNAEQVELNNNWISEKSSNSIIGFGSIHVDYNDFSKELDRMKALGLKGIKIHPEFQGFPIDDNRMWPIYEQISDRFLVMFHLGDRESDFSNPARLRNVLKNFPSIKAIAAHLGGWAKWQEANDHILGKDIYIDTSSTTWALPAIKVTELIRKHDIEKVLFGTDYPVRTHEEELKAFARLPLTSGEQENILYKNANSLINCTQ